MTRALDLIVPTPTHAAQDFSAYVRVTGAPANSTVTVTLTQTRGKAPYLPLRRKSVVVSSSGQGLVIFNIRLVGPTMATLLATGVDKKGQVFSPDAESLQVLG